MRSEFESREAFECIFGDEGEIDLSKDETGEYSFQPSRFAYSFFLVAWQYRQNEVDEFHKISVALNAETIRQREQVAYYLSKNAELQKRVDELQTAFKQLIEMENESISFEHDLFDKGWNQSARQTIENIYKLTGLGEQALKGGGGE